ncbi:hypothetical protein, partial [Akkermansia sp.]|uniref:hypothetical protein n=1 Tax=Akkermansia sp. TaxID=1872421 RepID=UPI003AB22AFC
MNKKTFTKRSAKHVSKGFALIATITLMMLLALLSVGLLTIASSQVRISEKQLAAAEAKSLARFSLEVSLGQLQCELGPDQRVSANSGILSSGTSEGSSPYILGAWNSWDTWLNRNNSSGMNIASTYDTGRSSMFRRWLISDPDLRRLSTLEAGKNLLGQRSPSNRSFRSVCLLGPGTAGTPVGGRNQDKKEIYARLVRVDDSSKNTGLKKNANTRKYIAWWITPENQKARINLMPHASQESTDTLTVLRSTWDTPGPDLDTLNIASLIPSGSGGDMSEARKLISRDTLLANSKNGRLKDLGELYHDITLVSSSLQTDSKFGGLKKDLNLMLSQEKLPEEFRGDTADIGLRPYATEDGTPTEQNRPIGSWNQLHLWANVWDSTTKRDGQDISATLQWNGQTPSTLVAADASANMGMMDNRYTYMRHPILLRYYNFIGTYLTKNDFQAQNGGWINTSVSVIPVFVWWNPYNVDMKMEGASGSPWGSYFGEHRFMPMLFADNVNGSSQPLADLRRYTEHPLTPYTQGAFGAVHDRQIADFGASYRKSARLNDSNGEVNKGDVSILKSGEIVVFALPSTTRTDKIQQGAVYKSKINGNDIRTDNFALREGWPQDLSEMASYGVNIYTGLQYQYFEDTGFDTPTKYTFWARFAETDDELVGNNGNKSWGTPPDHILCHKYTDEFSAASKKLRTFVMGAGLMNAGQIGKPTTLAGSSTTDPEVFGKISPAMLNLNWGFEEQIIQATRIPTTGWTNNTSGDSNENDSKRGKFAEPEPGGPYPYFIAYYGVSAKWGKTPVVGAYPEGKDYRAKTWQHSSPLFWGSQMPTASELGRSYSPYQFEVKNANSDFFPITISNILSNDGTRLSPFGGPGAEQVNKIVAAELPFQQPSSLAGFAGFRLTPGWYKTDSKAAIAKRFAYQSGVPGVGIGNSFADPMLPPDKVFSHNEIMGDASLGDFWDHGLMINDALWDSWFTSSLAARPRSIGGSAKEDLKSVLKEAFSTDTSSNKAAGIANRRLSPDLQGKPAEAVIDELAKTDEGYKLSAKYLPIAGGFNVNSTSRRAWEAMLMGLKNRKLLYSSNGRPSVLSGNQANFSRFGVASSNKSHVDDYGSIGITNGIPDGDAMAWSDLRTLSDTQIRALADNMVKEVKKRGPFLNMSDFINRRLQSGEMGVKGALQAAIDESSINRTFDELTDMVITPKVGYPNADAAKGSVFTAAPGYLIQSDVLAVLGNILTTRDDTFTIRAYGEVTSREGVVLSRAWCEAVVQRGINYVDPVN